MTTNAIGATGTTAATAIDAASSAGTSSPVDGLANLLQPPTSTTSADALVEMLIASATDTRRLHSLSQQFASQLRAAAQKEEVDKLHQQADETLAAGVTTGIMQIGSAGLQARAASAENDAALMKAQAGNEPMADATSTAYKTALDASKDYKLKADVNKALTDVTKSAGDATGKNLEADGKDAAARASSAKDAYDNENDEMKAQRDLKAAILQAYDALLGVKAQNATAFVKPA